jgi:4-hydroxy-tetrahydrodipicolinate synthase
MPFEPGLVHTPLTPFAADGRLDLERYGIMLDFHLRNGAEALAVPMHAGESVSLPDAERRALIGFAVKHAAGRAPVIAHVSEAGTGIAAALARFAQAAGAAAVVATTPYYWTPPPSMILQHFFQIGSAVDIPFFVWNAPDDMAGVKINTELATKLIAKLPNFAGVVDSGLDWQFMIELLTEAPRARPGFALYSGTELMVSASAIGASGMFSALAAIAPRLIGELFSHCRAQKLDAARPLQEQVAALRHMVKPGGVAALKAARARHGPRLRHPPRPALAARRGGREEARGRAGNAAGAGGRAARVVSFCLFFLP